MLTKRNPAKREIRPTGWAYLWPPVDFQAVLPIAWCSRCGGEVFRFGSGLCQRCVKYERRKQNDKGKKSQPLLDLQKSG